MKSKKITMDPKEFKEEHENLIDVLNSPSHKDDKKEAKKQSKELKEYMEKKQGVPKGADPAKHERCVQAVKKEGKSKESAYAICNASMKKSEESNMSNKIESEISEMAEQMEKSFKSPVEELKETIQTVGIESIKKSIPLLNDSQKLLLKEVLEDMKKSMEFKDSEIAAPRVRESIEDTKYDVDKADDESDEKLVKVEADAHNHQGDNAPEGFEGQIIKSESNVEEILKSMSDEDMKDMLSKMCQKGYGKEKILSKMSMYKGLDQGKVESMIDSALEDHKAKMNSEDKKEEIEKSEKEESKEEIKEEIKEEKEEIKEMKEELKEPKKEESEDKKEEVKKSEDLNWNDIAMKSLKANTLGRNMTFSVNGYYEEVLKSAKENKEELKKSHLPESSVNDIIEKGLDLDFASYRTNSLLNEVQSNGNRVSSFSDEDLAESFGMSVEELAKLLGKE